MTPDLLFVVFSICVFLSAADKQMTGADKGLEGRSSSHALRGKFKNSLWICSSGTTMDQVCVLVRL